MPILEDSAKTSVGGPDRRSEPHDRRRDRNGCQPSRISCRQTAGESTVDGPRDEHKWDPLGVILGGDWQRVPLRGRRLHLQFGLHWASSTNSQHRPTSTYRARSASPSSPSHRSSTVSRAVSSTRQSRWLYVSLELSGQCDSSVSRPTAWPGIHPAPPPLSLRANDHQVVSAAQMLGGIVAAALLNALTPGPLAVGVTLGNGTNRTQGVFIEMFTTAALVLSVFMLAAGASTLSTGWDHG